MAQIDAALIAVGFNIVESFDAAECCDIPWYEPLNVSFNQFFFYLFL